jgi:hypothetical protein
MYSHSGLFEGPNPKKASYSPSIRRKTPNFPLKSSNGCAEVARIYSGTAAPPDLTVYFRKNLGRAELSFLQPIMRPATPRVAIKNNHILIL